MQNELKNGVIPQSSVTFNCSNEILVGGLLTENTQDKQLKYINVLNEEYEELDTGRVYESVMEQQHVDQSKKVARDSYNEYERNSLERAKAHSRDRSPKYSARTGVSHGISSHARQNKHSQELNEIERREK